MLYYGTLRSLHCDSFDILILIVCLPPSLLKVKPQESKESNSNFKIYNIVLWLNSLYEVNAPPVLLLSRKNNMYQLLYAVCLENLCLASKVTISLNALPAKKPITFRKFLHIWNYYFALFTNYCTWLDVKADCNCPNRERAAIPQNEDPPWDSKPGSSAIPPS